MFFTVTAPATVRYQRTFTNIISNEGYGFNRSTGDFTCYTPGIYFFSFFMISEKERGRFRLVKNDAKTGIVTETDSQNNALFLRLLPGDKVWFDCSLNSKDLDNRSMFTGALVARGNLFAASDKRHTDSIPWPVRGSDQLLFTRVETM